MKPSQRAHLAVLPALFLGLSLHAATVTKSATGTDLADPASWGGTAPTSADTAAWDATSLGAGLTLGSSASWQGLSATGALSNISITGAGVLGLGSGGIDLGTSTVNLSLSTPVSLDAPQTWQAATGRTITVSGPVSGSSALTLGYGQTVTYSSYLTGTATTIFTNTSLSNVTATSGFMGGAFVAGGGGNLLASQGYAYTNNGTTATYQMRVLDGGYTKSVKVELAQSGVNVTGRVLYAKYISGSNLANDFDVTGTAGTIATGNAASGYGAASTTVNLGAVYFGEITMAGASTYTGPTNIQTTVKAGVASVPNVSGALGNNSAITFSNLSTSVLNLNGFATQVGSLNSGLGSSINLAGAALTTGGDNSTASYAGRISGAGGLFKIGTGTQSLTVPGHTATGGITVNGGTLKLSGVATFDAGFFTATQTYTVNSGATLEIQGDWLTKAANTYNINGGTLAFTKAGGDTSLSYVNNLNLTNGTVVGPASYRSGNNTTATHNFSGDNGSVVSSGFGLVKNGAAQTVNLNVADGLADADLLFSGVIFDVTNFAGSTLNKAGAGKLVLSAANTYSGPTTVSAGTLQIGNGGSSGSLGTGALTNSASVVLNRDDTSTIANAISGTGTLTNAGSGTVNLTGTLSYTGTTTVSSGRLNVNSALTSSSVTVSGGTLGGTGTVGTVTVASGSLAEPGSANAGTLTAATLSLDSGAALRVTPGASLLSVTTLNANGSNPIHIGGAAPTPGTYTLVDYSGSIGGTGGGFAAFSLGSFDTPRVAASLVDNTSNASIDLLVTGVDKPKWTGATNGLWDASTTNWKEITSGTATAFLTGDDVLFDDSATGTTTVTLDTAVTTSGTTFGNSSVSYTLTGTGSIGGAGTLTKSGAGGTVSIDTINSFTGNVFLNGGAVYVSSVANSGLASPLGAGSTISFDGGVLAFIGTAGATNRSVVLNAGGGSVSVADTLALSGVVSGSGILTKSGSGTITLSAANTFAGGTTVSEGRLVGSTNTAFGSGPITIGTGAADTSLYLANRADVGNPVTVSALGTGTVTLGAADANAGANASTYFGLITLNRPTTFSGEVAADRLAIEGRITGNVGTLTVSGGARTTFFSTASDFVGDVVVTGAGTILQASVATAAETIPDTASVTVEAGAFLQLASTGGTETINGLNGAGTVRTFPTSAYGTSLTVGGAGGSGDFSGSLINGFSPLSLVKTGAGTQTLSGANTYSGGTTLSDGVLVAASSSALGTGGVTVNGGFLDLNGQTLANTATIGAAGTVSGSGSLGATSLAGTVSPGGSGLGLVTLASATVASTANIALQLGALGTATRGTDYDALTVSGPLALDGTVSVTLNGLTPAAGQQFDLIDATGSLDLANFDINTDLVLPTLPAGLAWNTDEFASDGILAIAASGPTLSAFNAANFTAGEIADPLVSGPDADPDSDGVSNVLEYAFAMNPKAPGGANLPVSNTVLDSGSTYVGCVFTRVKGAADLTFAVQFSNTPDASGFATATEGIGYTVLTTVDNGNGTETLTLRDNTAVSPGQKRFVRVSVTY